LKNKYWPLHEPNKTKAFVKTIKDEASICSFFFFSPGDGRFETILLSSLKKLPTFVKKSSAATGDVAVSIASLF
jgi:hypothetical protein